MTSFSNAKPATHKILKAQAVKVDKDNRVTIAVPAPRQLPEEEEPRAPEDTAADEEARAMSAAARIINTAEMQANEILNRARMEALAVQSKIEDETKEQAAKILAETEEKAYKDGMAKAKAEGDRLIAEANGVLEDAIARRKHLEETLEPDIIHMVIGICDKLIGNAAALNPGTISQLVKQGFGAGAITGDVRVLVSPADYAAVVEARDELLAHTDGSANVEFVKDLSLRPLDCVIETSMGHIDCSLDGQYGRLKENLTYILQSRQAGRV